jgi:hypothetical protein
VRGQPLIRTFANATPDARGLVTAHTHTHIAAMIKGQRVVCVDDRFPKWVVEFFNQLPVKGRTYTVREVCLRRETMRGSDSATIALLLEELHNPPDPTHKGNEELAFKSERFAPLEEIEIEEEQEAELALSTLN